MKKSTKALIAGGIGVALLVGGAGTVSFWTDEAEGGDGVISAGTLDLGSPAGGGWEISHEGDGSGTATEPVAFDPSADQIVPGDVLSYTQSIPVTLEGENIKAEFNGSIDVTPSTDGTADTALSEAIESEDLAATGLTGATGDLSLDGETLAGEGDGSVEVTTTITFPWGTEGQYNDAKLGSLNFAVDYTLTQVPGN
ncbi:alternate-type signal peptide domain-containing protein [Brevibacterium sp. S111]|uniref:alternate-type signal peptide domain-containing protein n=1 Tax=unclassified Brevibacterium TaxID=2614124 RepID=UPI001436C909|nr:alternate-type signal peptide domain-containing protein [Brevibacterium sp. S111]